MPSPQQSHRCECGGEYRTLSALRQHQSYYCRGAPTEDQNKCNTCNAYFNTYKGLRQHIKKSHPSVYNEEMQDEARKPNRLWTADEEDDLAKAEAGFLGDRKTLLNFLQTKTTRTLHHSENLQDGEELNNRLRESISCLPINLLSSTTNQLKHDILTTATDVAKNKLDSWCEALVQKHGRPPRRASSENNIQQSIKNIINKISDPDVPNRRKRALQFRLAQLKYKNNRKAYANELLDGLSMETDDARPKPEEIRVLYDEIFGSASTVDNEDIQTSTGTTFEISFPISEAEIGTNIKQLKNNSPGPDGITLAKLKKIPVVDLLILFNCMLLLEHTPSPFRKSKTTLIPKTKFHLHLANNWRPITVSSFIYRLFSRILAKRTEVIPIHSSQRGFSKIDGCFANNITLENLIKQRRRKGQPLTIISLDLRKAFDSISHHSITRALKRLGIDRKFINLLADNYRDAVTTIFCGNNDIGEFRVNRGVKQGDPLSPFLFKAVIDELVVLLNERSDVPTGPDTKVCCLAYADDIILVSTTPEDADRMLRTSISFFNKRGLSINVNKSKAMVLKTVPSKKKTCIITENTFKVNDVWIPQLNIPEEFRYLGQKFSMEGTTPCDASRLQLQLSALLKAPLKPQQKLDILRNHLIPRYIFSLQRPNVSRKLLRKVDLQIRTAIKKILHLPLHCSNNIFYAPSRCGGIGIFNFGKMIPIISLSRINKLEEYDIGLRNSIQLHLTWKNQLRQMAGNFINTVDVRKDFTRQLESSFSGNGISQAKHHSACGKIITNPRRYWKGEDYIKALHLRFNLLPTKALPYSNPEDRFCRAAGCFKVESLCHILQNCHAVHWERISRHNYVLKRLIEAARKQQWHAIVEPHIRGTDGRLRKPDLILEKGSKIIVSDVAVHWEGPTPLSSQFENKVAIYSEQPFVEELKRKYPEKSIYVLPLIVGARGTWCTRNNSLVKILQLNNNDVLDMITTTMRGSWIIHQYFMRRIWQGR